MLSDNGLDTEGLHEIKPFAPDGGVSAASGIAAAAGFALRLAVRRLQTTRRLQTSSRHCADGGGPPILCCWPAAFAADAGHLYGPGLAGLGLDPSALVIVETAREKDALWAIEEGLGSGALALVLGAVHVLELTPARRLSLAAKAGATPGILLTGARHPAAAATASRWRVAPGRSVSHPLAGHAPGEARFRLALERCRDRPVADAAVPILLEWSDAAHRFRVASRACDRENGTDRTRRHAG